MLTIYRGQSIKCKALVTEKPPKSRTLNRKSFLTHSSGVRHATHPQPTEAIRYLSPARLSIPGIASQTAMGVPERAMLGKTRNRELKTGTVTRAITIGRHFVRGKRKANTVSNCHPQLQVLYIFRGVEIEIHTAIMIMSFRPREKPIQEIKQDIYFWLVPGHKHNLVFCSALLACTNQFSKDLHNKSSSLSPLPLCDLCHASWESPAQPSGSALGLLFHCVIDRKGSDFDFCLCPVNG